MTLHRTFARSLVCGLALVSATIAFQVADAESADSAGDAQLQARDLLSGTVDGLPKTFARSAVLPAEGEQTRLDPQEQARQLILGKPTVGGKTRLARRVGAKRETTQAALQRGHRGGYVDPQEAARRMILGNGEAAAGVSDTPPAAPVATAIPRASAASKSSRSVPTHSPPPPPGKHS